MKIIGFTFIRNAIKYDYPAEESLRSLLPLCDEVIVAVGNSDDETRVAVAAIDPKIRIIDTVWDDSLREGGQVLAVETNKALDEVAEDADWAFYLQGDEVLHENDYKAILSAMERWKDDPAVEGLLFDWHHFYGAYNYEADSRQWYRHEVRIIRPDRSIRSYQDAMGFRKNDQKLSVKSTGAKVYHYGWVKNPKYQQAKQESFHKMWHDDGWVAENVVKANEFDYGQIDSLKVFEGTHPAVMRKRIEAQDWQFDFDPTQKRLSSKESLTRFIERMTGKRIGEYKNYRLI
jgi:glycosyltransferase involved in cell wall biosynthesis